MILKIQTNWKSCWYSSILWKSNMKVKNPPLKSNPSLSRKNILSPPLLPNLIFFHLWKNLKIGWATIKNVPQTWKTARCQNWQHFVIWESYTVFTQNGNTKAISCCHSHPFMTFEQRKLILNSAVMSKFFYFLSYGCFLDEKNLLTHFQSTLHFYTPWKHQ